MINWKNPWFGVSTCIHILGNLQFQWSKHVQTIIQLPNWRPLSPDRCFSAHPDGSTQPSRIEQLSAHLLESHWTVVWIIRVTSSNLHPTGLASFSPLKLPFWVYQGIPAPHFRTKPHRKNQKKSLAKAVVDKITQNPRYVWTLWTWAFGVNICCDPTFGRSSWHLYTDLHQHNNRTTCTTLGTKSYKYLDVHLA